LAWKLAVVLQGGASEKLLDSYEAERKPVANAVLSGTDVAFQRITTQASAVSSFFRRVLVTSVLGLAKDGALPPRSLLNWTMGLSISYKDGTCLALGNAPWARDGTCLASCKAPWAQSAFSAGNRLADVRCKILGQGSEIYTLQLLSSAPHTAYRLMLVAGLCPSPTELQDVLSELKALFPRDANLEVIIYISSQRHENPKDFSSLLIKDDVYGPVRVLVPVEEAKEDIATLLRLGDGRAALVVRPDGYIAVSQNSGWSMTPIQEAMIQLGLVQTLKMS
jgi:hypothetical protein